MTERSAVRALVAAAKALAADRAIVPAIADATGLSRENVELALSEHLETDPTDEELDQLFASASTMTAPRVAVVLSANVFVGALRAIAFARACAPHVTVRPSRRDPTFARALVEAVDDRSIVLDEALDVAAVREGEIHVYGRDDTIADVRARAKVPVRGHGSGMGLAAISEHADLERAANELARDVVIFDQRGCLSPRIAFVLGDDARGGAFADALHEALERLEEAVPRGAVPAEERAAAGRYLATMTVASRALVGRAHGIGVAPLDAPLLLPPPYRHVHVAPVRGPDAAARLAAPYARALTTIGGDDGPLRAALASALGVRVRSAALGRMQRPPLDGPVDLRDLGR